MMNFNITPAVKHLIIANVIFFALALFLPSFHYNTGIYFPENPNFKWWQIITNMFMHVDFMHLFFNMYALFSFGVIIEQILGSNRFLLFYFICGLGAVFFNILIDYYYFEQGIQHIVNQGYNRNQIIQTLSEGRYIIAWKELLPNGVFNQMIEAFRTYSMGASGAIYGILVAFGMFFPNAELSLLFIPVPIKAKIFIPILLGIELFSGFTGFSIFGANIGHFAHLGGAIIGFIFTFFWKKRIKIYHQ